MSEARQLSNSVFVDKDLEPLIKDFMKARKSDCAILEKAIASQDWEQMAQMGHKLSGVCGGYGFDELGLLGEQLEHLTKAKNIGAISGLLKLMSEHINTVKIVYR